MRVYLDYNATAPPDPAIREEVAALEAATGNASSIHWAGREAKRALEGARGAVAKIFGRKPSEILFTSGGSEANNLALFGTLEASGRRRLLTSAVEHPSVLESAKALGRRGIEHQAIGVDGAGRLDLSALGALLAGPPALVSVMAANNETGVVSDLGGVIALAKAHGAILHVDAVQAAGRIPLPLEADLITLSGHKLGGHKGAGVLVRRANIPLAPLIHGGPQERGFRAGTEPFPLYFSLARALEATLARAEAEIPRLRALQERLEEGLVALGAQVLGAGAPRLVNTTSVLFAGVEAETLLVALDLEGIAASSGSACSSGSVEPSHVLVAMGQSPAEALSAVRFSTGRGTTATEIEALLAILPRVLAQVRSAGPARRS
ncbi:MAG: cysteine desulfurase family protein [Myxococcota bacterium]